MLLPSTFFILFFFNDTATTEIYTLSLHDALPICSLAHDRPPRRSGLAGGRRCRCDRPERNPARHVRGLFGERAGAQQDRKSTRLNSSHQIISYAVFCLKKKKRPPRIAAAQLRNSH